MGQREKVRCKEKYKDGEIQKYRQIYSKDRKIEIDWKIERERVTRQREKVEMIQRDRKIRNKINIILREIGGGGIERFSYRGI